MEAPITAALPPDDLAALDRVCRHQGVSRHDAVESALRWYIEREGDCPSSRFVHPRPARAHERRRLKGGDYRICSGVSPAR